MEYQVSLDIESRKGLDRFADSLAELGGAASISRDGHRAGVTMTVEAPSVDRALAKAIARVSKIAPGHVVAAEALTIDEADRRLTEPGFPELAGVTEVAELLGVTRQRASMLQRHRDFPSPVAELASGPVWRKADLRTFAETWTRRPGRPRKELHRVDV